MTPDLQTRCSLQMLRVQGCGRLVRVVTATSLGRLLQPRRGRRLGPQLCTPRPGPGLPSHYLTLSLVAVNPSQLWADGLFSPRTGPGLAPGAG